MNSSARGPSIPRARRRADRVVQLTPFVEEQRPNRVRLAGGGRTVQRLDEAIAAVEQDLQQLIAELLVADRVTELLDRENHERVPLIERVLKRLELGRRRRGRSGNGGRSRGVGNRHHERDADAVVERGDIRLGGETCDCGADAVGGVRRNRVGDHRGELLHRGPEIVGKIVEPRNQIALDQIEALARRSRFSDAPSRRHSNR